MLGFLRGLGFKSYTQPPWSKNQWRLQAANEKTYKIHVSMSHEGELIIEWPGTSVADVEAAFHEWLFDEDQRDENGVIWQVAYVSDCGSKPRRLRLRTDWISGFAVHQ